jgi:hypothetical protein
MEVPTGFYCPIHAEELIAEVALPEREVGYNGGLEDVYCPHLSHLLPPTVRSMRASLYGSLLAWLADDADFQQMVCERAAEMRAAA